MAFLARQKTRRFIGLDLGSHAIKLAEVEQAAAGIRLVKSLIQELPIVKSGQSVDRAGWLASALKEFDAREVHVSISGPEAAIRRVHMPLMSKRELPEAVKWQIKEQISFPIQEAMLDFRVMGEVWDKDIKKQDVLVAAASKAVLEELIGLVERSGARVASLEPTQCALWRCVTALIPEAKQGSVAVIEIGASETEVTIAKDGEIRVVRDLAVGSASMTEALVGVVSSEAGDVTIDHSKAEALKRRYGVLAEAPDGTTEEGVPLFHLSSLMRPVLEHLLTEVSRVFDFYKVQMDEAGVSRVLLCGGGASLKQLQSFLAEGLGMTVEVFNPLVRITDHAQSLEPEQVAGGGPRLAVAIGLAINHGEGLNLVPSGLQQARVSTVSRQVWVRGIQALAAAALAVFIGLQVTAGALQKQIRREEQVWAGLEPSYRQCMNAAAARNALDGTVRQLQQLSKQQPVWEGLFKEVGALIPSGVELDELVAGSEPGAGPQRLRIQLKGRAVSGDADGQGSIAQFVEALERSGFFSDVELVSSQMRSGEAGKTSFEIEGVLE